MHTNTLSNPQSVDVPSIPTCSNLDFTILFAAVEAGEIDLEQAADTLLKATDAIGKESGIYTEAQLNRKMRLEQDRALVMPEDGLPDEVSDYLFESCLDDLIDVSRLTSIQEICFRLHLGGFDCRSISKALGRSHKSVATYLREARRKLQAACEEGIYAGWYEVYLSEVRRSRKIN
ncbi:MAG: hypothetical protein ABFD54_12190 [Armatimonadota bacterium]|nr:hypothetical protein [bacterium]